MRVLIVDDEKSIRTSTSVAIQAAGHQAASADNGQIAVLKLQEDAYDLVFLDLRLGDEDGLDVLEQAKRIHPGLPIVVFTAYATVASAVAAIQRGAFDYLEKPFTPEHLIVRREELERLYAAIGKLPLLQQQVLQLRVGDGLLFAEIAVLLNKREEAVRKVFSRTLALLRTIYDQQ